MAASKNICHLKIRSNDSSEAAVRIYSLILSLIVISFTWIITLALYISYIPRVVPEAIPGWIHSMAFYAALGSISLLALFVYIFSPYIIMRNLKLKPIPKGSELENNVKGLPTNRKR